MPKGDAVVKCPEPDCGQTWTIHDSEATVDPPLVIARETLRTHLMGAHNKRVVFEGEGDNAGKG